jgi:hypothetical protein
MNANLQASIKSKLRTLFFDMQEHSREEAVLVFEKTMMNAACNQYWNGVSEFFSTVNIAEIKDYLGGMISIPISYTPVNETYKRNKHDCMIRDLAGKEFWINGLNRGVRSHIMTYSDSVPLGAVIAGMLVRDASGINEWFDAYRNWVIAGLKSDLKAFLSELRFLMERGLDGESAYESFYSALLGISFAPTMSHDISKLGFDGLLELRELSYEIIRSKEPKQKKEAFVEQLMEFIEKM